MRTLILCSAAWGCTSAPAAPPAPPPDSQAPLSVGPDCVQLPVGPPVGQGYRVAQGFGKNRHLGEDWNGVGGGNTDLGDPVYAMADGQVHTARDFAGGWGLVVRIEHLLPSAQGPAPFESLYAHLDEIMVQSGQTVSRGDQIGTIGDAHGAYIAHLHLEVRDVVGMALGPGYSTETAGYIAPRTWVSKHQADCP